MSTVSARIAELENKTEEIKRELTKLRNLPPEPPVGEVVKFTKRLGRQDYTYAALHTEAGWYMTGRDNRRMDWSDLVAAMDGSLPYHTSHGWTVRVPNGSAVPTVLSPAAPTYTYLNDSAF